MRPVYFPQLTDVIRFPLLWAFLLCIPALQQLHARAISAISTRASHSATPQNYSAADWSEAKSGASSLGDMTLSRPQPAHLQSLCLFHFFFEDFFVSVFSFTFSEITKNCNFCCCVRIRKIAIMFWKLDHGPDFPFHSIFALVVVKYLNIKTHQKKKRFSWTTWTIIMITTVANVIIYPCSHGLSNIL